MFCVQKKIEGGLEEEFEFYYTRARNSGKSYFVQEIAFFVWYFIHSDAAAFGHVQCTWLMIS